MSSPSTVSNGPSWWRLRSEFQKEISAPKKVRNFLPDVDKVTLEFLQQLPKNQEFNILPMLARLNLELTCLLTFGERLNAFNPEELDPNSCSSLLIDAAEKTNSSILPTDQGLQLWRWFETSAYKRLRKAQEYMEKVAIDLVSQKIRFFKDTGTVDGDGNKVERGSLIEEYLKNPNLDVFDIVGMAADLLLAGIDTTSYTMSFALYHIARHPDVQQRLHEESKKLLPCKSDALTAEMLRTEVPYYRAVLKEVFRLNPISIGVGRILNKDLVFSGYLVSKGTVVVTQNMIACRSPENFDDPLSFKPERWLKRSTAINPYLVLPFGHGMRACIARRLAEQNILVLLLRLSGLYETKPPISKAKMAAITRSAMRAIKFYKHVVQSVEKFILKCKPEYKVPGLYVIDSIVRQSRHQFGPEKDVFAPRFARNIKETFANLFRCAPEDKSRIIRVLNLWQKNSVFAPEVIQPIFDLADPNHPIYQMPPGTVVGGPSGSGGLGDMSAVGATNGLNTSTGSLDMSLSAMAGGSMNVGVVDDKMGALPDLSCLSHEKAQNVLDTSTLRQLEHMQQYLKRQTATTTTTATAATTSKTRGDVHMHGGNYACHMEMSSSGSSTKIHHSDIYAKYAKNSAHELTCDDEDDVAEPTADNSPQHAPNLLDNNNLKQLLNDPNVLRQLQTLQNFQKFKQQEDKQHKLNEMRLQEEAFEKHLQIVLKGTNAVSGQDSNDFKEVEFISEEQKIEVINLDGNDSRSPTPDRDRYKRRRSRSRSRSRSRDRGGRDRDRDRRRRSRSRSRSRSPRSSRRRSSRDRDRSDRMNRDKEKERRKRGLPDIKKEHLSVCSTTLWVGHLSKLVYQEELSDTFGEYGDIVSIDQIVPRGCAFIVMNRRQDAHKAMQSLKNHKLQGRAITISWAAGKGVKSKEWKDFWDLELGVTYIPWSKLDEHTDLDSLEEGGMFDEDSMPNWMKDKINHLKSLKEKSNEVAAMAAAPTSMLFGIDTTQPPPGPPPPGGPPPMMSMVPGQFSMAAPPGMGGPPRMLGVGMQLSGIPMPPNLVPGMPPPHPMMMPPNMMPPGFPPMPGQVGAPTGPMGAHLGLPPGATQFPPPPGAGAASTMPPPTANVLMNITNDDQMDIEMDEEDAPSAPAVSVTATSIPQISFNQPPPMFATGTNAPPASGADVSNEIFNRDRNRNLTGNATRWGTRSGDGNDDTVGDGPSRWRDNNGPGGMPGSFNENRGGRGGNAGGGGPMSIPPLDLNNPPQRPDFMNDFDNRGGPRVGGGPRGGNHNGDFFPNNMQNRFNQPTSLLQMRIPPPNSFNPRMGGPMFMRGGQGGPGGRQQTPGYFNPRNPFDRDMGRGGRGGNRGGGGGARGGRGNSGPGNWSDEEGDDGNNFKRRGPSGGNRFRDRDNANDDRHNRDRGGRRSGPGGGGNGNSGSRHDRDHRDNDRDRDRDRDRNDRSDRSDRGDRNDRGGRNSFSATNRRSSRDENRVASTGGGITSDSKPLNTEATDTEDDWDRELEEYDARMAAAEAAKAMEQQAATAIEQESVTGQSEHKEIFDNDDQPREIESAVVEQPITTNTRESEPLDIPVAMEPIPDAPIFNTQAASPPPVQPAIVMEDVPAPPNFVADAPVDSKISSTTDDVAPATAAETETAVTAPTETEEQTA